MALAPADVAGPPGVTSREPRMDPVAPPHQDMRSSRESVSDCKMQGNKNRTFGLQDPERRQTDPGMIAGSWFRNELAARLSVVRATAVSRFPRHILLRWARPGTGMQGVSRVQERTSRQFRR